MNVKGVIFDLDDTLYDYQYANQLAMKHLCEYTCNQLNISYEAFNEAFCHGREATKKGLPNCAAQHNRMLYCQKTLEYLGVNPFSYALEMYEAYWSSFLDHMKMNTGVLEVFQHLKREGVKVAICTDLTTHIQHRKIRKLGIADYIDYIVTSEEAGVEKPSEKIFMECLQKMDLPASDVVFVGDDYQKDIVGACQVGMRAIWYNPVHKKRAQDNIYSLVIGSFLSFQMVLENAK